MIWLLLFLPCVFAFQPADKNTLKLAVDTCVPDASVNGSTCYACPSGVSTARGSIGTQLGPEYLSGCGSSDFGGSISLSANGKVMAVGAKKLGSSYFPGQVKVYTWSDSTSSWGFGATFNGVGGEFAGGCRL